MSKRIRITAKRRRELDVDKLVFALLTILEDEAAKASTKSTKPGRTVKKESAA